MQPCPLNHCNSCDSKHTVLSFSLQGMHDILKIKVFAFTFSLLQKTPKMQNYALSYAECTNVLPYPVEPGSVPEHILHASLKQKTKMKHSAKLFHSISAWAENEKGLSPTDLRRRDAAAVRRGITCCWAGWTDPRSDSLLWGWVVCNSELTAGQDDIGGDSKQTSSDEHTHTYTHTRTHSQTLAHTHTQSPKQSPVYMIFTLNTVCWNMTTRLGNIPQMSVYLYSYGFALVALLILDVLHTKKPRCLYCMW